MIDPKLGTRRICPSCRAPHFDLNKIPAKCPKCGLEYDPNEPVLPKRRRKKADAKPEAPVKVKKEVIPVLDDEDDGLDDTDDVSLEDLEDLEDGDDDILEISESGKDAGMDDDDEEAGIEDIDQRLIDDYEEEDEDDEEEEIDEEE